jgi:hypothetical protein
MRETGPTSDRDKYDADEDPLVELARIVSEDVGFSGRMTPKPKIERAAPTIDPDALSSDLEAELMQELETSFSARAAPRVPVEPSVSAEPDSSDAIEESEDQPEPMESMRAAQVEESPEPQRIEQTEPPDRDDPDDLLRSIEQQLSQFERRVRSDSFADEGDTLRSDEDVELEPRDDWRDAPQPTPVQSEYRFRGPAGVDRERRAVHEDDVAEERLEVPTSVADAGEPIARAASLADEADYEYAEEQSAAAGETVAGDEEVEREGWAASERGEETRAEHGVADLANLEAELSRELDPAYAGEDARWPEAEAAPEDRLHVTAAAAVIAPEHRMRPPPRPAQPQRARSARGLVTAAAILIVVGLGGAAAMYFRSVEQSPAGPPPVIAAQEGPVKIEPAPAQSGGSAEETVGEAVYNRVAGRSSDAQENVVEGAEEPREIERIVPPLRPGSDEPEATEEGQDVAMRADAGAPPAAGTPSADEEFGPRRVTTYVVRPDGTIVATGEATGSGGAPSPSGQDMAAAQTEAMEPKPVETVVIDEPRTAGTPASPAPALESAPPAEAPPAVEEEPMEEEADTAAEIAALEPLEPEPAAEPAAVDELQEAMAPAPEPTAPTAASGYVVQISSQASQEAAEATFAGLQRRYPSILSELKANIQRADLGERGIYYRVRVGPWADRTDAIDVCEALKTAGADCYVTQ